VGLPARNANAFEWNTMRKTEASPCLHRLLGSSDTPPPDDPGRRAWLRRVQAAALLLALDGLARPAVAAAQTGGVRFVRDPFTLGVASGMPRPDSIVLWTRLAPEPASPDGLGGLGRLDLALRWQLAEDERFGKIVREGQVTAAAAFAHSVRVKVEGLEPGRVYFYRFFAPGGVESPVGRTRTAPAEDARVDRLRFALASCQHYEGGYYAPWRHAAAQELDFVLFVGDYIYESNYPRVIRARSHETGDEPKTLAGYRNRYAHSKQDPDLREAHRLHPWILTWDDHEVDNDYAGDESQDFIRGEEFLLRRAAAYRAYFEHLPWAPDMAPRGPDMRIVDRYRFGRLAELWTLDDRQYRDVHACPGTRHAHVVRGPDCPELFDPRRTLLGEQQERWLYAGLRESQRGWKLLGQQTVMAQTAESIAGVRHYWNEGWDGYQAARQRLFDAIAGAKLRDVLALGGDVHMNVAADLKLHFDDARVEQSPVIASEFVCTSITSRARAQEAWGPAIRTNPHLKHLRSDERGYALLSVSSARAECRFWTVDDPKQRDGVMRLQAAFAVEAGRAGVQAL
jgi:alkaline phosphatase D